MAENTETVASEAGTRSIPFHEHLEPAAFWAALFADITLARRPGQFRSVYNESVSDRSTCDAVIPPIALESSLLVGDIMWKAIHCVAAISLAFVPAWDRRTKSRIDGMPRARARSEAHLPAAGHSFRRLLEF